MEVESNQIVELLRARTRKLHPTDEAYPVALRDLRPAVGPLWIAGELPARRVAVVGARRADLGGLQTARTLGRSLAAAGFAVVSGGAVGCDTAAHEGALGAGGRTVVVLGSGIARPYPRENVGLLRRAADAGCVLTPFAPEVEPLPGNFARRNRILAALGEAVVVVRAGRRSGALSTAGHALRLGRPVLAVPGSPTCPSAAGSNDLLRRGCAVALDADDVRRALGETTPGPRPPAGEASPDATDAAATDDPLLELMSGGEPARADELAAACGLPAGEVVARLGFLEMEGWVARLPDGRFRAAALGG